MSDNRALSKEFSPSDLPPMEILERIKAYKQANRLSKYFPDTGPLRRELYVKHLEFMDATREHDEVLMLSANKVGKSLCGGYMTALHATGLYPHWWTGKVFDKPTMGWVCNQTTTDVRDINQQILLGDPGQIGTGMIPRDLIIDTKSKASVPDGVEIIYVRHKTGGQSTIMTKCHPAHSRVLMASGEWKEINKIQLGEYVGCPDGKSRPVTQLHAYSKRQTLRISTRAGSIEATPNHPFLTVNRGWVNCGDLVLGDELKIAYTEPACRWQPDWKVKTTALMIGDGCSRGKTPMFVCNEPEMVQMIKDCLPPELYVTPINHVKGRGISWKISSKLHKNNTLKNSLSSDGIWNKLSINKYLPSWVFGLPRKQRVLFMRWLFGCDGTVNKNFASYTSSSLDLIQDVRLMLWSLGIYSNPVGHIVGNQSKKKFQTYKIDLTGYERIKFTEIGKLNRDSSTNLKPKPRGPRGEITAIDDVGLQDVYCVGVEDVHELIVDGFHVGNSYDQGRTKFQGRNIDYIWADEEIPADVYGECIMRLMVTKGLIYCTYTPVLGLTPVTVSFLRESVNKDSLPMHFDAIVEDVEIGKR